jgi:hypothetical protein
VDEGGTVVAGMVVAAIVVVAGCVVAVGDDAVSSCVVDGASGGVGAELAEGPLAAFVDEQPTRTAVSRVMNRCG